MKINPLKSNCLSLVASEVLECFDSQVCVSVYASVCLSVCLQAYISETTYVSSFLCTLPVAVVQSSSLAASHVVWMTS